MRIVMDAHGGDNAPLAVMQGARLAADSYGVEIVLCGKEKELRAAAAQHGVDLGGIEILPAGGVIPVEADPTEILRGYADSSLAVGLGALAEGSVDAFVSAGSTGAMVVGSSLIVKRIKGIERAALGTVVPTTGGGCYMLMDAGANTECRPEMLQQFGIMGAAYMEKVLGVERPRVGVVNIGTEQNKGNDLQIEACALLAKSPVNFIGNVEPRELPLGGCDVAVTDGFVGNVVLKLTEGMGKLMSEELKKILLKNTKSKIAAALVRDGVTAFRKTMDYTEYGGAPLMGISKPVIKAHGSSNANAFKNAVRQAKSMVENGMIEKIQESLAQSGE